jgi:uncharacterized damage-inducible protein DinB
MSQATFREAASYALEFSARMIDMYFADLTPAELLHRPTAAANCPAWTLGHLILSERWMASMVGASESTLPPLPEGFERRFSRADNAPAADDYGDTSTLLPLFHAHRRALVAAVKAAPVEKLAEPQANRMNLFSTVGEAILFNALHQTMHAGQVTITRRALGRPPVI